MTKSFTKAIFTLLFFSLALISRAQLSVCSTPPTAIQNGEFISSGFGNLNSSIINDWYVSYGSPTVKNENCPGSSGASVWMWSYSGGGEGIFTCFRFEQGITYDVSLWVKNTNYVDQGNLKVMASKNFSFGTPSPSPTTTQIISANFSHSSTWTQVKYTFTANDNYTRLLIFPLMTIGPINGTDQYELVVDKVEVVKNNAIGPVLLTGPGVDLCEGDEFTLEAFLGGAGNPNYIFTWSEDQGSGYQITESGSKKTIKLQAKTTSRWKVRVEDPNDTSAGYSEAFIDVVVKPGLNLITCNDTLICHGDSAGLFAIGTRCMGDTNHLRWTWRDTHLGKVVGHSRVLMDFPKTSTLYRVTLEDTVKVLNKSKDVYVQVDDHFTATARNDTTVCVGSEIELSALISQCKNAQLYFRWEKDGSSGFISDEHPKVTIDKETKYSLLAYNEYGLKDTSEVLIHIFDPPTIQINGNDSLCLGEALSLSVSHQGGTGKNYTYEWTGPDGKNIGSDSIMSSSTSQEGYYKIRVNDGCSYTVLDSVAISFFERPEARFVIDTTEGCSPFQLHAVDSSLRHFNKFNLWLMNQESFVDSGDLDSIWQKAGTYDLGLIVRSGKSCADTFFSPNPITIHPQPNARIALSTRLVEENTSFLVSNLTQGAVHHYWQFGNSLREEFNGQDTVISLKDTGYQFVYQFAENEFGCLDTALDSIRIVEQFIVFIPNAFSPNGDEHNPLFYPSVHGVRSYHLIIYNRWGERILDCDNCSWDGYYKSRLVEQDVYFYVLRFEGEMNQVSTRKGSITVLR